MAGTKRQKIDISKTIVEAIHSMDRPGRFLKKCSETGQWNELSRKDAADRAAQAMAYAIRSKDISERRKGNGAAPVEYRNDLMQRVMVEIIR